MKVDLLVKNSEIFVFDVEVWKLLRAERIIGEVIGSFNNIPVLPIKLLPEEVAFLLAKNIARIIKYQTDNNTIEFDDKLLKEQICLHRNIRKEQLEKIFHKIVVSKRKKGDTRKESEIFEEVLTKSSNITSENMIWPIMLQQQSEIQEEVDYDVLKYSSQLRCDVYKDLWERGYYVTSGQKFGGDFLAYLGDPILYHAVFIIKCVEYLKPLKCQEIVAFGRLGTSVKKKAVLATLVDNKINYITINWIDD